MKGESQDGHVDRTGTSENSRKPTPLQFIQPALDVWSTRERLALATAVSQDRDKNWVAISKAVKPFATEKRPDDYFAPRKCARQYAELMENVSQPKRRGEAAIYDCTPEEMLQKRLTLDRTEELQSLVKQIQEEYLALKNEVTAIQTGGVDNKSLTRMFNELKEEEKQSSQEELIPVSLSDIERLESDAPTVKQQASDSEPVTSSIPDNEIIHSSDLGVPADEDYENGSARIEESHREMLRVIAGSNSDVKEEVIDSEAGDTKYNAESVHVSSPPRRKQRASAASVEIKQESDADETNSCSVESPSKEKPSVSVEELVPAQSPSTSSASSTPRRSLLPPPVSSDAEADGEYDDEATEGEDNGGSRTSLPVNEKSYRTWKKSINMIIRAAQSHKHASVFLSPVTDDIAAGYSQVINRPMDLSTIKRRVDNGEIRTTAEFQRDVMLMFTNAVMYNNAEHDVHKMALEMYDDVMYHIEQYLSTQVMSPSIESKVLRRRVSDHNEEEHGSRRRRGSTDSDVKREEPSKKSRK